MAKSSNSIFNFDLLLNQHHLKRSLSNFMAMRNDHYVEETKENDNHPLTLRIEGICSFI